MRTPADFGFNADRFPSYREGQLEAAEWVVGSKRRFRLVEAPTGSGKSLIAMTVARIMARQAEFEECPKNPRPHRTPRTLILVSTKALQDQLAADFPVYDLRGQANYRCLALDDELRLYKTARGSTGCDVGPCHHGVKCSLRDGGCTYYDRAGGARSADVVLTNYAYWLSINRYGDGGGLGEFDLLVCDEGHRVPDLLTDFCGVRVQPKSLGKRLGVATPRSREVDVWSQWAGSAGIAKAQEMYKRAKDLLPSFPERSGDVFRARNLVRDLAALSEASEEWVVEGSKLGSMVFTPTWGRKWAESYLFAGIPNVLIMSATLSEDVAPRLGISKLSFAYREIPSTFHPANRPLIWIPTVKLRHGMSEGEKVIWARRVDEIVGSRLGTRGIIHTKSYERAEDLRERSEYREYMMSHAPGEVARAIERFIRMSPPVVLVTPAAEEGYDFPDDLCRWQIIAKLPFVYAKSPLMKARQADDSGYLNSVAAESLIQTVGRSTRSVEDWSEVFVIDDNWKWFRHAGKFPRWFEEAERVERIVPAPMTGRVVVGPRLKKRKIRVKRRLKRRRRQQAS